MSHAKDPTPRGAWIALALGLLMVIGMFVAACPCQGAEPLSEPITHLPARSWGKVLSYPDLTCRVKDAHGKYIRSASRKSLFLRALGLAHQPAGYYIDHIVPLACGGCDLPSNMSLLSEAEWKAKTPFERSLCGEQAAQ